MELLLGAGNILYASLRNKLEKWSHVLSSEGLHLPHRIFSAIEELISKMDSANW